MPVVPVASRSRRHSAEGRHDRAAQQLPSLGAHRLMSRINREQFNSDLNIFLALCANPLIGGASERGVARGTTVRALVLGRFGQKKLKKIERYGQKTNKNRKKYKGGDGLGRRFLPAGRFCSAWAGFFDLTGPVFLI